MRIANTVFFFPWWGLLLLALLPPVLAAAAAFPMRKLVPNVDAVADARTKLVLLGISAYTFTVAFSVNTLWYQDIELGDAALSFDYSVSLLQQTAQDHADDLPADIDETIEALRQPDVIVEAVSVLPHQNQAFDQAWDELKGLWADAPSAAGIDLRAHAEDAEKAFLKLSEHANSPGVPDVILIVIVLLGMALAGVMAAAPRPSQSSRRETAAVDWLMIVGVVVVGLMQWSLWVLNSKDFVLSMILPYFGDSAEVRSVTALQVAVGTLVLVVLLGAILLLRIRLRQRGIENAAPDDIASNV